MIQGGKTSDVDFPEAFLPTESTRWRRAIERRILAAEIGSGRNQQNVTNENRTQAGTISQLARNLADVESRMQEALTTLTVSADQITSGVFSSDRIPEIPENRVIGIWSRGVETDNDITTTSDLTGNDVYAKNAALPSNNITGARTAVWIRDADGRLGNTASSLRLKTNVRELDVTKEQVLSVPPILYNWISQVKEHEENPDAHVATEIGFPAEAVHEAGLWHATVYRRNSDASLALDGEGLPVVESVHYTLWPVLHQVALRAHDEEIKNLQASVSHQSAIIAQLQADLAALIS